MSYKKTFKKDVYHQEFKAIDVSYLDSCEWNRENFMRLIRDKQKQVAETSRLELLDGVDFYAFVPESTEVWPLEPLLESGELTKTTDRDLDDSGYFSPLTQQWECEYRC